MQQAAHDVSLNTAPDSHSSSSGTFKKINLSQHPKTTSTGSGNIYEMTAKPSSDNEALETESESKVDLGASQTSAGYDMRKRQIAQNADGKKNGGDYASM